MSITRLAISKNRITLVLVTLLLSSGILAYLALPKEKDPGFIVRTAVITTRLPGASPERMELLITDKIEKKIQEMPEVDFVTSESRTGISIVNANFLESYKVMRPIFDDLRRKVDDVVEDLPEGIVGPDVNDEFGDVFGSVYTLTGEGFSYAELDTIAQEIRDRLLKIPEIAKVSIHGAQEERIFVEYNNSRLAELGLSPQQLSAALRSANILSSGGNVLSGRERIVLEPTGNFESVDDLRRTIIPLPEGTLVYLGDIVDVRRDDVDPPNSVARVNGEPTLAIAISMREGGDILKLGEILTREIPLIEASYPWGIELHKVWFQADLVRANVDNFTISLLQAIGIVILVMIFTLRLRTGLVVASLIPCTMVITFFLMQSFGITINQVSLAALIIALGLLVDNAIVVVESVLVKRETGASAVEAAVESGRELMLPLLISSLTTAAAFLPIALAESAVGEFTADIFYVVTLTLLTSWILAMTFIPLLTTRALRVEEKAEKAEETYDGRGYGLYRRLLLASLRYRLVFGLMVVALFVFSLYSLRWVPAVFIPPSEDPVFSGKFEMPLGTSIETSQAVMADIDDYVKETFYEQASGPGIASWLTFIGDGGPRFELGLTPPNPNAANSFLVGQTVRGEDVEPIIAGITAYAAENHPDLQLQLLRIENGPPVGYPIQIRLSGPDIEPLYRIAEEVTSYLTSLPEITAVKNSWGLQTKKLVVEVDQERARLAGASSEDVAISLQASLAGIDMTQYREGDDLIPVVLRSTADDRQDIGKLDGLSVYAHTVPLKQVADTRLTFEPGVIERRDRERTMELLVTLRPGVTATEVNQRLSPWLAESSAGWPAGYTYEEGGESEESDEANASIAAKLPIAGMLIVLLLVGQFNSIRKPIIILTTIPLGIIGVTFGLIVGNSSMGFFTLLGIISLAGIIINNAIVLLDRIQIEIEELGKAPADAVVAACQQRLRPILLTTATTVLGMLPLWWGGSTMFQPMAVSIIFGLAFATGLTLLVVPVLYSALFRVRFG